MRQKSLSHILLVQVYYTSAEIFEAGDFRPNSSLYTS
jgi:hypothetical protein